MTVTELGSKEFVLTWGLVSIPPQSQEATPFSLPLIYGKIVPWGWSEDLEEVYNTKLKKERIEDIVKTNKQTKDPIQGAALYRSKRSHSVSHSPGPICSPPFKGNIRQGEQPGASI